MARLESPCASSLVDVHLIRTATATVFIVVGLEEDDLTAFRLGEARRDGAGNEDSVTGLRHRRGSAGGGPQGLVNAPRRYRALGSSHVGSARW
jgi:hypothetical protein